MGIREELAEAIDDLISGNGFGSDYTPEELGEWADTYFMPVVRKAQAEVLAQAIQAHHDLHPVYGSTSVCYGGAGGQAVTPHCAVVCPNPVHDVQQEAWYQVERNYVEIRGQQ